MALCKRMLTKNPAEEAPVNRKNFLSVPPTFSLSVKTINATPSKRKIDPEMIRNQRNIDPLNAGINGGMKRRHTMTMKTPTRAQNMDQLNFPFTFSLIA